MRGFAALGCCLVVLLGITPGAGASTRWSPPLDLASGFRMPYLTTLGDGTTLATLAYHHGVTGPDRSASDEGHVEMATQPPGGVFGAPVQLTPRFRLFGGLVRNFSDGVFVHVQPGGAGSERGLLARSRDGSFGDEEALPRDTSSTSYLDEGGDLTMWGLEDDGRSWVMTRRADGAYGPKREVSTVPDVRSSGALIVDPDGAVTLVRVAGNDLQAFTAPPGGAFGPPQTIASGPARPADLALAHDARGDALLAWVVDESGGFGSGRVHTIYRPAGGPWQPAQTIPGDPVPYAYFVRPAMNAAGDAAIAWKSLFGDVAVGYRRHGGTWERAVAGARGTGNSGDAPAVAIGPGGDAVVLYPTDAESSGEHGSVAIDHPRGGGWQRPEPVLDRGGGFDFSVSVNAGGLATAAWRREDGLDGVQVATHQIASLPPRDDAPPQLSDFKIRRARAFSYRVSEGGRVEIVVRRARGKVRRALAVLRSRVHRGSNTTELTRRLRQLLEAHARYRARIVAVDRHGQYSKPRGLAFERGG